MARLRPLCQLAAFLESGEPGLGGLGLFERDLPDDMAIEVDAIRAGLERL
jgi:hypothetical protein